MNILNNLKEIRMKIYMMSKRDFSRFLGIQEQQYLRYESGRTAPSLMICLKISKKLRIPVDEIWYLEGG